MILYEGLVPRCSIMDEIQILKSYCNHIPAPSPWKLTLLNKAEPTLFIGTNAQSHPPTLFFITLDGIQLFACMFTLVYSVFFCLSQCYLSITYLFFIYLCIY